MLKLIDWFIFRYTVGSAAKVLYPAAGGSDDWAMSVGIK